MNQQEKETAYLKNEELNEAQIEKIQIQVAEAQRFLQLITLLPEAKEEYERDNAAFMKKYGLTIPAEGLNQLYDEEAAKLALLGADTLDEQLDRIPETVFRYRQYIGNKLLYVKKVRDELLVSKNGVVRRWRLRQLNRCNGEFGVSNRLFIHALLCFELTHGCSVGCPFCGLGAMKLQKVFSYTEENKRLWLEVLGLTKQILGEAAGHGTLYLASEPLDNPDYESFEQDYYDVFGRNPQITTAVPLRNIERTKYFLKEQKEKQTFIHRFSVRSLEQAREIFAAFTPLELLQVELIPQYPEAPSFIGFVESGRERDKATGDDAAEVIETGGKKNGAGSISCVTGFVVNMAEQTIRLSTPCSASDAFPQGEIVLAKEHFTDAEDFARVLTAMITDYMKETFPVTEKLHLYEYYRLCKEEETKREYLEGRAGAKFVFEIPQRKAMLALIKLLLKEVHTRDEAVQILFETKKIEPKQTEWCIRELWKKGIIYDSYLFNVARFLQKHPTRKGEHWHGKILYGADEA